MIVWKWRITGSGWKSRNGRTGGAMHRHSREKSIFRRAGE
nr:MAG TPA: hypothetical protein [Caudoviricetes sp.]